MPKITEWLNANKSQEKYRKYTKNEFLDLLFQLLFLLFHFFILSLCITSISSVQLLSPVWLFATPWTAAHQASLSITISRSLLKFMSIESMMPSNHLILYRPLLLPPSVFPSIRVFQESVLCIRWPEYGVSASASVLPMNIQGWFPLGLSGLISSLSKGLSRVFSNTTVQKHHFFSAQLSLDSNFHIRTWLLEKP